MSNFTVGVNIKRCRTDLRLSLRQLGDRVNLTASFLSQIERNKVSPSLSTLMKIARELHTTIGSLVGEIEPTAQNGVVRKLQAPPLKDVGRGRRIQFLTPHERFKIMEPILIELQEGGSSGDDPDKHYGQEFVYILEGAIKLTLAEQTYSLSKGDSIYYDCSTPHSFRNVQKGITRGLWIACPPAYSDT